MPVRRDQQVPGRIRKLVQQDECTLAPVDDELLLVVALRRAAEHAAVLLIGTRDVLEAPRRPEALYSHFFQRKKPSMAPTTTTMEAMVVRKPVVLSKPGKRTFIPKKPVMNVNGSITTLKIVST